MKVAAVELARPAFVAEAPIEADRSAPSLDFSTVYRAHVQEVASWVNRLGGPGADVPDLVHDVFVVVYRKLHTFRGEAKLTTWLYRITVRVVLAHRRRARWREWLGLGGPLDDGFTLPSDGPSPSDEAEARQAAQLVHRALEGLREQHRTAFILFELEGLSGEQIAEVMDVKLSTVWVWLHRGRERFRERVMELGGKTS